MLELKNDSFYELIKAYKRCIIDYVLIEDDIPHQGYRSHKDAILFAMHKVTDRELAYQREAGIDEEPFLWSMDIDKAEAELINPDVFLYAPNIIAKNDGGKTQYDCDLPDVTSGGKIPYWYAFLNTPHGTGYTPNDFIKVNETLFPNGEDALEVYEWTTDWSDYFDDGHEWWGAACWSVYDASLKRYVVILASTTD